MTGQELGKHLDNKMSHSYTGFLDTTKKNRLFKEALRIAATDRYLGLSAQSGYDDIDYLITTGRTITTPTNNKIWTAKLQITSVTNVSGTTWEVTTYLPHNLITGDVAIVAGVAGFTSNPNGSFSITSTPTSYKFRFSTTTSSGTHTANTGTVYTADFVTDYWHLLSLRSEAKRRYYDVAITGLSYATPVRMTLDWYSRLRTGSMISVSAQASIGNDAVVNAGTMYVKKINDFQFDLYTDAALQSGVAGDGEYTSGARLHEVFNEYAKPLYPVTKISKFNTATLEFPRYENADNQIKIYPSDTVQTVTMDYLREPDVDINVSDTTIDLELYYSASFLYYLVDVAMGLYAQQARDDRALQYANLNKNDN
jgi:hypothetical protein